MQRCARRSSASRVTDFTVLLEGESGVGKELVARQIHELSRRRNGPFVAINCAALVETLLEAELFGIEERTATGVRGRRGKFEARRRRHAVSRRGVGPVAVGAGQAAARHSGSRGRARRRPRHAIASTSGSSRPPIAACAELVERRLFRPDLFYRLSGVDIRVPTLRERRADILELAQLLPRAASADASAAAVGRRRPTRCWRYDWPGNVRELERLIERAVALGRIRRHRARRSAAGRARRLRRGARCRRCGATTRCARGRAATRGSCSTAATATSAKPAACSTSAITRCSPICAFESTTPARPDESWGEEADGAGEAEVESMV